MPLLALAKRFKACLHVFHLNLPIRPPAVAGMLTSCLHVDILFARCTSLSSRPPWGFFCSGGFWCGHLKSSLGVALLCFRDLLVPAMRGLGNLWVLLLSYKWPHVSWMLDDRCGSDQVATRPQQCLTVCSHPSVLQCPAACPAGPQGMPGLPGMKVSNDAVQRKAVLILLYYTV